MKAIRITSNFWALSEMAHSLSITALVTASSASALSTSTSTSSIITGNNALRQLANYHPVVVEGMGYYDPRDPSVVAKNVYENLQSHFAEVSARTGVDYPAKPLLLMIQGDPLHEFGISAITPKLSIDHFDCKRGLVCLDPEIDSSHSLNADRHNVILELKYSQLVEVLMERYTDDNKKSDKTIMAKLEDAIDHLIIQKNDERAAIGKPPMKEYFKQYALLQEVTKAAIRKLCGDKISIAHTSQEINPFSVTSFYKVGLDLRLVNETTDMVMYRNDGNEVLDFSVIDKR